MNRIINNKGITLVTLVITIIVLLILAGVSIGLVFNGEGLFNKANDAAIKYNQAKQDEADMIHNLTNQLNKIYGEGNNIAQPSIGNQKKEGRLTLAETNGIIVYPNIGKIEIIEHTSNGRLSVSSSDDSIASASISGTTITITPKSIAENKEVIITVKSEETEEYNEQTVTYLAKIKQGGIIISATPNTRQYDGNAYDAFSSVKVTPADALVEYSLNDGVYQNEIPRITEVGEYTITIRASKVGYETKETSITVTVLESVAKIGTVYYNTLQRAVNAVPITNTNTTVVLLKDITEDVIVKENMNITLNLNNCTMTGTITNSGIIDISGGTVISEGQTITNQANGKITISGGIINGTGNEDTVYNNENAQLLIVGGTLTSEVASPLTNYGMTEINGTTLIEGKALDQCGISNYGVLNVTGGALTSPAQTITNRAGGKATISGGTINGTGNQSTIRNPENAELLITGGTVSSEANVVLSNSGTTEISEIAKIEGKATNYVAINNYGTLQVKGGTLTAPANVIKNQTEGKVTISGGTLTSEVSTVLSNSGITEISGTAKIEGKDTNYVAINNYGTLQVKGGTLTAPANVIKNQAGGKVTISGGTISGTGNWPTVYNTTDAEITITGGTLISASNNVINNEAKATISGGTINGTGDNFTLSNRENAELVITGGTITSEASAVLSNLGITEISGTTKIENKTNGKVGISNTGVLNVKGGTLTSSSNVINNRTGGKAEISGGTISGTGNSQTVYNNADAEITITGGTLTSVTSNVIANQARGTIEISGTAKIEGKATNYVAISNYGILRVKGGTFTSPCNTIYGRESTSVIEISGGTITGTGNYSTVYILLGTFKMTAGTVTNSGGSYGVYNAGGTTVSHTGGSISSKNF